MFNVINVWIGCFRLGVSLRLGKVFFFVKGLVEFIIFLGWGVRGIGEDRVLI